MGWRGQTPRVAEAGWEMVPLQPFIDVTMAFAGAVDCAEVKPVCYCFLSNNVRNTEFSGK